MNEMKKKRKEHFKGAIHNEMLDEFFNKKVGIEPLPGNEILKEHKENKEKENENKENYIKDINETLRTENDNFSNLVLLFDEINALDDKKQIKMDDVLRIELVKALKYFDSDKDLGRVKNKDKLIEKLNKMIPKITENHNKKVIEAEELKTKIRSNKKTKKITKVKGL